MTRGALLAFDTATEACSAALAVGGRVIERYEELERGHGERILPMIDALLREADMRLRDLDAVAFGRGPGAFTGVRLAASLAQGLAFGAELPVVPVSNLAALAHQALAADVAAEFAWIASDARMQEVYSALYRRVQDGGVRLVGVECLMPQGDAGGRPPQLPSGARAVAAGRGLLAYPALAGRVQAWASAVHADMLPRAGAILSLARLEVAAGQVVSPAAALPVYLRDQVAEIPVS